MKKKKIQGVHCLNFEALGLLCLLAIRLLITCCNVFSYKLYGLDMVNCKSHFLMAQHRDLDHRKDQTQQDQQKEKLTQLLNLISFVIDCVQTSMSPMQFNDSVTVMFMSHTSYCLGSFHIGCHTLSNNLTILFFFGEFVFCIFCSHLISNLSITFKILLAELICSSKC